MGIATTLRNKARARPKRCYWPDCTELAVDRSHFLPKSLVLSLLGEDGCVVEFREHDLVGVTNNVFKKVGLKKAFTFRGFCEKHDNHEFRSIEKEGADFTAPLAQLLCAYRASLNELRKIEKNLDWYSALEQRPELLMRAANAAASARWTLASSEGIATEEWAVIWTLKRRSRKSRPSLVRPRNTLVTGLKRTGWLSAPNPQVSAATSEGRTLLSSARISTRASPKRSAVCKFTPSSFTKPSVHVCFAVGPRRTAAYGGAQLFSLAQVGSSSVNSSFAIERVSSFMLVPNAIR